MKILAILLLALPLSVFAAEHGGSPAETPDEHAGEAATSKDTAAVKGTAAATKDEAAAAADKAAAPAEHAGAPATKTP